MRRRSKLAVTLALLFLAAPAVAGNSRRQAPTGAGEKTRGKTTELANKGRGKSTNGSTLNPGTAKDVQTNKFITKRTLEEYLGALHPNLVDDLLSLGPKDILLDGGAGKAVALRNYLFDKKLIFRRADSTRHAYLEEIELPPAMRRAQVIGVAFKRAGGKTRADRDPRFSYIEGDIGDLLTTHPRLRGKVALIVDHYGALKYSHVERTLATYLDLLRKGGKLYFSTPHVTILDGETPITLVQYLERITGARLAYVPGSYNTRFAAEQNGTYVLEKVAAKVHVPKLAFVESHINPDIGGEATYELERRR